MLSKKRNVVLSTLIAVFFIGISANNTLYGQEPTSLQNRLKSMLGNFNNVRFSSVAFYELNDKSVRSLKEIIKKKLDIEDENPDEATPGFNQDLMDSARADTLVGEIRRLIANGTRTMQQVRRAFDGEVEGFEYLEDYYVKEAELRVAFQMAQPRRVAKADIYRMFLITMPDDNPETVPDILALILCKQRIDKTEYEAVLIQYYNEVIGNSLANEKNIITHPELMNFIIDDESDETKTTNLYDKLAVEFRQGNCQIITPEVRGIGTELKFTNYYGKSTSMISNENDITDYDIEKFIRISDGQPFDYQKSNEVIVSPDYISYRKYEIQYYQDEEGNSIPYSAANTNLPSYGAEIKYGLDEINYPSFWSERMMLRAVWDNLRLGVVLPTAGWSSLSKSLFSVDRRFTHGGVGLSGAFDFPIKIIPQSGIFSLSGSYVFGDAEEATYKDRQNIYDSEGFKYLANDLFYNDYFIRYTGQGHYTFGFSLDESYLLRFGIGATVYGAETWHDFEETNELNEQQIVYKKENQETVGGISMKFEFMSTDVTTPFGASLQYFDESLYTNAWLQIPIVRDAFFIKVDVKGYVAAFKDVLHPWESKSVFIPSARLIFNF